MYTHLQSKAREEPPVTLSTLRQMKADGEKIACITAYDASFATVVDNAGVDLVLVGDSLGMVVQGHETTIPVSMDDMIYHCQATLRGLYRPFLLADLPFMSYATPNQAAANSARLMQEGKASMVKLEGGAPQLKVVEHLARCDIPICAHIGLTPQSVHKLGGFSVQGRSAAAAKEMVQAARDLESAGADIVLLECIPTALAQEISAAVAVPTIGIGAGPHVDGQILVLYDVLDITPGRKPRFAHNFLHGRDSVGAAIGAYVDAVKSGAYPAAEHCFT
ncbi:MAG: 3-methyl-2-oxobutanoate hydroxymethyltransferase [Gammaproteobacteria bacterium]|nr:3-methyl-2-oxobutanoate hydroxymethyltransferase [Gammaproteobacteria bacterium]